MRLWTLHPRYLDARGLVALWREALLARAVLAGRTVGYRHHPQLDRFRTHPTPEAAIDAYLAAVHEEACRRGYRFDRRRFGGAELTRRLTTTQGQLEWEARHLAAKLQERKTGCLIGTLAAHPDPHPLFRVVQGPVEPWERGAADSRCASKPGPA